MMEPLTRDTVELIRLSFIDDGLSYEQRQALQRMVDSDAALRARLTEAQQEIARLKAPVPLAQEEYIQYWRRFTIWQDQYGTPGETLGQVQLRYVWTLQQEIARLRDVCDAAKQVDATWSADEPYPPYMDCVDTDALVGLRTALAGTKEGA